MNEARPYLVTCEPAYYEGIQQPIRQHTVIELAYTAADAWDQVQRRIERGGFYNNTGHHHSNVVRVEPAPAGPQGT